MGDYLPVVDLGTDFVMASVAMTGGYGGNHNVFVSDNLEMKAWGNNDYGQLNEGRTCQVWKGMLHSFCPDV